MEGLRELSDWNPMSRRYKRLVLLLIYYPLLFALFLSLVFAFRKGVLPVESVLILSGSTFLFVYVGWHIYRGSIGVAAAILVGLLYLLAVVSMILWGLAHPIGILLFVLSLQLHFFMFSVSTARRLGVVLLLLVATIGIFQQSSLLSYDHDWVPILNTIDLVIITLLLFISGFSSMMNSIGTLNRIEKINNLSSELEIRNKNLQEEVIVKVKEIISKDIQIAKSQKM